MAAEKGVQCKDNSNQTLKSIFNLLQENLAAYMKSSDVQSEQLLKIRTRRVRRSRTIKASSCPNCSPTCDIYYVKDQSTSVTPPKSPSSDTCPSCQHVLIVPDVTEKELPPHHQTEFPDDSGLGIDDSITEFVKERGHVCPNVINQTPNSLPLTQCARTAVPDQTLLCSEDTHTHSTSTLADQYLRMARENVELKVQMQEMNRLLKSLKTSKKDDEDEYNEKLFSIDRVLSKVLTVQKQSEVLCDKLCEGLEQISTHQPISKLPPELKDFCNRIGHTIGQDFRPIGRELGLEDDILDQIEKDFTCEEDCFQHIILEWCRRHEAPSYHDLVSACHKVNPDILKSNPLSKRKAKVLQQHYDMMCTEMLEIHVLPHLVSSGIMSFKMQRYVLQPNTRDQRISRLISIIYTRENGFDELCKALDHSDQGHVSNILRQAWNDTLQENVNPIHDDDEIGEYCTPSQRRQIPSIRCQSIDSSDDGNSYLSDSSFSVGSPTLDSTGILQKIYDILIQNGIPPK